MNTAESAESLHRWDVSPAEARAIQAGLRNAVRVEPLDLDACVVLELPSLKLVDSAHVVAKAAFPYVPGLLSFRESPPLLDAWSRLRHRPNALIVDGHGYAHPRRFGIACHLGVILDLPTVGCAKSVLVGEFEPPGGDAGEWTPLIHEEETVGAAVRTRTGVAPVFVSVGHRCDLESAMSLVHLCIRRYRLPETTRHAHDLVNQMRRDAKTGGIP
jgi:deoxyribonuclease V